MSDTVVYSDNYERYEDYRDAIISYVSDRIHEYRSARVFIEETWLECWAHYINTTDALDYIRGRTLETIGNVSNDWRHKVSLGKAFETVEQIHSYLMGATFPAPNWFDVVPEQNGYSQLAAVVRKYLSSKIDESNFRVEYEIFLKQLIVTGTSHLCLYWLDSKDPYYDKDNQVKFKCMDVFDCWNDPEAPDVNSGNFIRRYWLSKAAFIRKINSNEFTVKNFDIDQHFGENYSEGNKDRVKDFQGLNATRPLKDRIEIYEFWGCVHLHDVSYENVCITYTPGQLLKFEKNTYKTGRPFVSCSYIPLPEQPYGIGAIQPSLGLLVTQNSLRNQQLDGIEVVINPMYEVRENSIFDVDDVYTEPGKTYKVQETGSIVPIRTDAGALEIAYQDHELLDRTIDRNFGTVPSIGLGQGRNAERVTATEVKATQDAGGARLLNTYKRIEDTALRKILHKILGMYAQWMSKDEIIRVAGDKAGQYNYFTVEVKDLKDYKYKITPMGAESIIARQQAVDRIMNFTATASSIEPMAALLDYEAILMDLLVKYGFDEPMSYIKKQQEAGPVTPQEEILQQAQSIGGKGMSNALQANLSANGGQDIMAALASALQSKPSVDQASIDQIAQQQPVIPQEL